MRGGVAAYVLALSLMPCTAHVLAAKTGLSTQSAGRYLRELCRVGLARPVGHELTGNRGGSRLIIGHGNGVRCGRPSAIGNTLALIVNSIRDGATTTEVCEKLGMGRTTVTKTLQKLKQSGLLHVGEWRADTKVPTPVYVYGSGVDALKPKKTPRRVTNARYWAARRAKLQQMQVLRALAGAANDAEAEAAA
jgi:predicted transcriptional regulator